MSKQWVTKLKGLTETQMAVIPVDLVFERGDGFVKFLGTPPEFAVRLTRAINTADKDVSKTKSSVIKLLAAAKDADTPNVYTETIKESK